VSKNIVYQSDAISAFYRSHRRQWSEFYPSERTVFEALAAQGASFAAVLDVGCAAGGLGEALMERFGSIASYTGVDLNRQVTEAAQGLPTRIARRAFVNADICENTELHGKTFDLVTALGVADWNVDATGILAKCWEHVRPDGYLVISLRLTPGAGVCDVSRSFQHIWFEDSPPPADAERAAYNVFNVAEAIRWLKGQAPRPSHIRIYGYWGKPSAMARTPYDRLVFSVIAMRKPRAGAIVTEPVVDVDLPPDAVSAAT
jgi:SAM-dependent methyltransferase